jgi:hypothetical protein
MKGELMRRKQSTSVFPVYIIPIMIGLAGLILGALCSVTGVMSYDENYEWIQGVTLGLGCFAVPGIALVSMGFVSWYTQRVNKKKEEDIHRLEEAKIKELKKKERNQWLEGLDSPSWGASTCEVEMESKFIFPLLKFLGYDEREMKMRVRIPVQEGRLETTIEADWVLLNGDDVAAIIEAKAPRELLSERVVEQAKSYAIRLNAPVYIITNGLDIAVYHREVIGERAVFRSPIDHLFDRWDDFQNVAGRDVVFGMHDQLKKNLN